jgi:hypothetical protein
MFRETRIVHEKIFKTHSKFSYNLHILYYEILKDLINFKLYLNFLEFLNYLDARSWSCFLVKMFKISFGHMEKVLKLGK